MAKSQWEPVGTVYGKKKKPNNDGWMWVIGIVVFLIILAAA